MPSHVFGLEQIIDVGPMSGKSNVHFWLERHGIAATDDVVDVCTVPCGEEVPPTGSGPLDAETRRLLDAAVIEGEMVDAETGTLLAQGVDGPRRADAPPLDTWADIDRGFARWADRVCARLEARTGTGPPASTK